MGTKSKDVTNVLENIASVLATAYRKEAELYGTVLSLSELQRVNLMESDDIRDFISLLQQKEDLMRAIERLELEVSDAKAQWLEIPEDTRQPHSGRLNSLLDQIIVLIERIMHVEHENSELLATRKQEIEQQLATIHKGRKANNAMKNDTEINLISAIR